MLAGMGSYAQTITPQFKPVSGGLMSYFYPGHAPTGFDTLWNAQAIRSFVSSASIKATNIGDIAGGAPPQSASFYIDGYGISKTALLAGDIINPASLGYSQLLAGSMGATNFIRNPDNSTKIQSTFSVSSVGEVWGINMQSGPPSSTVNFQTEISGKQLQYFATAGVGSVDTSAVSLQVNPPSATSDHATFSYKIYSDRASGTVTGGFQNVGNNLQDAFGVNYAKMTDIAGIVSAGSGLYVGGDGKINMGGTLTESLSISGYNYAHDDGGDTSNYNLQLRTRFNHIAGDYVVGYTDVKEAGINVSAVDGWIELYNQARTTGGTYRYTDFKMKPHSIRMYLVSSIPGVPSQSFEMKADSTNSGALHPMVLHDDLGLGITLDHDNSTTITGNSYTNKIYVDRTAIAKADSVVSAHGGGGGGSVTSITPGYGFTSSTPITTAGTLTVDTTSSGGLLSKSRANLNYVYQYGSYANPTWLTSLAWSKITGTPTTLAGYAISDVYTKTAGDARYLQLTGGSLTGSLTITSATPQISISASGGGTAQYSLSAASGNVRDVLFQTSNVARWLFRVDGTAETGSNIGSDFSINSRTDAGAALSTPFFIKRSTGNVIIGGSTDAGYKLDVQGALRTTGLFTMSSTSAGYAHYNTVDQTTNYEYGAGIWASNIYKIITANGGTGTARNIQISAGNNGGRVFSVNNNQVGAFSLLANISQAGGYNAIINGINSNTSGIVSNLVVAPTISSTSTGGYKGLVISPFESGFTGSGGGLLIDAGTNSNSNFSGTHTSKFTVDNLGNISTIGNITLSAPGGRLNIAEGTNGRIGQTALVAGTKTVSVSGVTTSTRAFVQLVTPSGTNLTTSYQAVCTAGTLTIQANIAAGTINTADTSTVNYIIIN